MTLDRREDPAPMMRRHYDSSEGAGNAISIFRFNLSPQLYVQPRPNSNLSQALGIAASVIAVIDLSAKVASRCSEYYANVKNARDDIERLQREAQGLKAILERVYSLCDGPKGVGLHDSQSLREGVEDCQKQLAQLEAKLKPRTTNKLMSRYGIRALRWPLKSNEVDRITEKLGHYKDNISFSLQVDQEYVILFIFQIAEADNGAYRVQILNIHQKIVLDKLPSADNAAFDSHDEEHNARCYQGTRAELLRQIYSWAGGGGSERIFWLNGMAGTGKSTISRTVAQNFADKGELGASFFFKRGEGDRGHAGMFFATIATQLVQQLPSLAPHVKNTIEADPGISRKALKQQFDALVLQPLGKIQTDPQKSSSIVIVVDALDECDGEEDVRTVIRLFSQVKHIASAQLKFFLTSRPELPIRLGFEDIRGKYERLVLHQIPEPIVKEDISSFLEHELATIREDYNKTVTQNRQLPVDWPGHITVQSLVEMAIPLFIFATTICRFINDRKYGQPKDQLAKVLKYQSRSQASKLDTTYLPVLDQLLVGVTISERKGLVKDFQQVVGSIVILASPLSATSLDRLLGVPEGTVDSRIDLLHSVLSIPSRPDHPIRLLHLSFRDFLVDTEKRETNPFWVDEKDTHNKLATRCLKLLSTGENLKKDICNLRTPERSRADVDKQRIDSHLPSEMQYACQYWVYHLKESGSSIYDGDQVHNFLKYHFLHWLESLSLIGRLRESIGMVDSLMAIIDCKYLLNIIFKPINSSQISMFLYDAKRFILSYYSIAELSPLQLYSSALIFAPKKSIIRNTFQNYIPDWILQEPNTDLEWNAVLQTLEGHSSAVNSVAFSPDSKLLASASSDETVKIWDAATGTLQQTLEGHSAGVRAIAFSPDSKLLASASSDKTVKIWDAATGMLQQTLKGHSNWVNSVVFSPDSKLLASASDDKTVKVWVTATGILQQTLEGHSDWVNSVVFSPDSKLLASASGDNTVKVWVTATGILQQTLEGHSGKVNSIVFSPDSKLLASASDDNTVKVWVTATGILQQTLEGHSSKVNSIVFSPDSKLLASASDDKTVKVWVTATGILQQTLEGHSNWVNSVVFSPDSKLLASASDDKTVKVWVTATGILQQTLKGHSDHPITDSDWVNSVVFSPDSKLLASASDDNTVKVWVTATGILQQTLEGHSSKVNSVAFSPDSKLLASASYDETVKIWNISTGVLQQTLAVNGYISSLSFDITNSILITDLGRFKLDGTTNLPLPIPAGEISSESHCKGLSISGSWVLWNSQNLLWLPPDFRALTSAISCTGSTLAIGCPSGRVFIIGINSLYVNMLE
ncbi:vegetative incompatibility HET-E-1 protein [Rutstroemia sp. NJR-2017a BVV2]|nr:vegetative incompatibility HET-E-1 protein [Rutstroemia sp. NJR-2017a BVV2]PQE18370.1 vegetative incompatibility HET-E-1 protein [Rutstroemia sp. NJR-2017a BVV2]